MAKAILFEEYHLTIYVPHGMPKTRYVAIRRTLNTLRFLAELRRALFDVVRHHPTLRNVKLAITR